MLRDPGQAIVNGLLDVFNIIEHVPLVVCYFDIAADRVLNFGDLHNNYINVIKTSGERNKLCIQAVDYEGLATCTDTDFDNRVVLRAQFVLPHHGDRAY
jgi:hypothetical protein